MKNKLFEVFVCMLLMGTCFVVTPDLVSADQEGDYTYTVSGGVATITGYTGAGGAITIPSTLGGFPTVHIGDTAFDSYNGHLITSVLIPSSVTTIGKYVFHSCTSLTSVTIPNNVTTIGNGAFDFCSSLTSVTIPNSVTTIGKYTFYSCISLTSVTIPHNVTTIGNSAFEFCSFLTSVTIPGNVTTIWDYAFSYCSSLTSITFLGLVAPTTVGFNWILGTPVEIRGHVYAASDFPAPGDSWHGLTMGTVLSSGGGGENKPPLADFTWTPSNPEPNQEIVFDASASNDPDGSITLYEWDWNNDGMYEESSATPTATYSWSQAGNNAVTVRVTDNSSKTGTITKTVNLGSGNNNTNGNDNTDNKGTPGFELVFVIGAIAVSILLWKKKRIV
jgi:hypothetical protein